MEAIIKAVFEAITLKHSRVNLKIYHFASNLKIGYNQKNISISETDTKLNVV